MTLIWLTEVLWLIYRPSWGRLLRQLILLVLIFSTRYNALCYPVIAAGAFVLARKDLVFKITGIAASVLVLVLGILGVGEITRQKTGVRIFSAFSGWQMANNTLYVYPFIRWIPRNSLLPNAGSLTGWYGNILTPPVREDTSRWIPGICGIRLPRSKRICVDGRNGRTPTILPPGIARPLSSHNMALIC